MSVALNIRRIHYNFPDSNFRSNLRGVRYVFQTPDTRPICLGWWQQNTLLNLKTKQDKTSDEEESGQSRLLTFFPAGVPLLWCDTGCCRKNTSTGKRWVDLHRTSAAIVQWSWPHRLKNMPSTKRQSALLFLKRETCMVGCHLQQESETV